MTSAVLPSVQVTCPPSTPAKAATPFQHCRVFLPFAEAGRRHEATDYQHDDVIADIAGWFEDWPGRWDWVPVLPDTVGASVAAAQRLGQFGETVVVNLCDGDDVSGYPGLSVVEALEAARLPYTGADSAFYTLSTSKLAMKQRLRACGVPTAPWREIAEAETDVRIAGQAIGFPLFIKPDQSAAAAGITSRSLVHTEAEAVAQVGRVIAGMHDACFDTVLAERFLPGREFSVLVVADKTAGPGGLAFTPCERVFPAGLRPEQRFVTYNRNYGGSDPDAAPEDDGYLYAYAPAPVAFGPALRQVARDAFRALDGTGYARVDIRQDEHGRFMVLEVNAACGLSDSEKTTTVGAILAYSGISMRAFLDMMLGDAWRRWQAGPGLGG